MNSLKNRWRVQITQYDTDFPTPLEELGSEIRQKRLNLGWSLKELANEAGITVAHLSLLERGLCRAHRDTINRVNSILEFAEDALHEFEEGEALGLERELH